MHKCIMVPTIKALAIKTGGLEDYGSRNYAVTASFRRFGRGGRKYPGRIGWARGSGETGPVPPPKRRVWSESKRATRVTGHGVGAFTLRGDVLNASLAVAQHLFILSAQRSYCGVFVFDSGLPTCVELAFDKSLSRVSPLCCLLISNSLTLFFIKCRKDIYSTASRFFKILARVRKHWSCVINTCF